jgi:hypothetical protein
MSSDTSARYGLTTARHGNRLAAQQNRGEVIKIHSSDRMDRLIAAAVRQGFIVRQTQTGSWHFRKGSITTMIFYRTPNNIGEWVEMINTLRGAGLVFPILTNDEDPVD